MFLGWRARTKKGIRVGGHVNTETTMFTAAKTVLSITHLTECFGILNTFILSPTNDEHTQICSLPAVFLDPLHSTILMRGNLPETYCYIYSVRLTVPGFVVKLLIASGGILFPQVRYFYFQDFIISR